MENNELKIHKVGETQFVGDVITTDRGGSIG